MKLGGLPQAIALCSEQTLQTLDYYADEIYNADSTVDKSEIEIIKAEDVL